MALKLLDREPMAARPNDPPALPKRSALRSDIFAHMRVSGKMVSGVAAQKRRMSPAIEAERLFNRPWAISRAGLAALVADYVVTVQALAQSTDDDDDDGYLPYLMTDDGIACIPVSGPLTKNCYWRTTAYGDIGTMVAHAMANDSVKAVLLCFDSPGGEVSGMFELADYLSSLTGKPIASISDDNCYSAAYCLAAATDQIFVTQTGGTGSIGCWTAHVDYSKMLSQEGIQVTYVFSGDKKIDGNPTEPLPDRVKADMQEETDRIRAMFVQSVALNRGVSVDALMETEAGVFMAEKGTPLLCDAVGTIEDALGYLRAQMASADPDDDQDDPLVLPDPNDDPNNARQATAIPPHKTATSTKSWDGPANEKNLKLNQSASYYKKAYAQYDPKADGTKKSSFKFIHHEVSSAGDIGAANIQACRSGIAVLNGARGGTIIPAADRKGVYNHLSKHLKDAGVDAPPLKSEAELVSMDDLSSLIRCNVNFGGSLPSSFTHRSQSYRIVGMLQDGKLIELPDPGQADYQRTIGHEVAQRMLAELPALRQTHGDQVEARVLHFAKSQSEAGDSRKITITAVPYGDISSDLGGFKEIYQSGCFAEGLGDDPRAVFDHDYACILGRVSAGTARFWDDADGVHVECEAPETQWADDLLVSMRRKDISGASAAFFILKQRWQMQDGERVRIVERALMREASVYAFPAYDSTQASAQPAAEEAVAQGAESVSGLEMTELDRARLELLSLR